MTVRLIISGLALCAMTAAGGIGLAMLSAATHTPQTRATTIAAAPVQRYEEPILMPAQEPGEPSQDQLLPEDIEITFVASRTPNDVATSLAPERSRFPNARSFDIRPAVVSRAQPQSRVRAQEAQPQTVRTSVQRSSAAAIEAEPEWVTGVFR